MHKKLKIIFVILQVILLANIQPAIAEEDDSFDQLVRGDNYESSFSRVMDNFGTSSNLIKDYYQREGIYSAINQGFTIVNLMRYYDMYNTNEFLQDALSISDNIGTYFIDLRYNLAASYYRSDINLMSNYRYFTDNLLISWGLQELSESLDSTALLDISAQEDRLEFIDTDLPLFDNETNFREFLRIDLDTLPSTTFKTFPNLFASYIILMSGKNPNFHPTIKYAYDFIKENMTNPEGGVFTLHNNGLTDTIVTLSNTILFVNVGLQLYKLTGDPSYRIDAEKSLNYIQTYAKDVSITKGYVEALEDNVPLQQSKSLFSHALVILAFLEFASLGVEDVKIDLLATWETINRFFRVTDENGLFRSTITRQGQSTDSSIKTIDNLMMLFALSQLPNIISVEYDYTVKFSDKFIMNVTAIIPEGYNSTFNVYFNADSASNMSVLGTGELQTYSFELDPPRPNDDSQEFYLNIDLSSENVTTDYSQSLFEVINTTGINLSIQLISLLSVILIVVFVLFVNRVNEYRSKEIVTEDISAK